MMALLSLSAWLSTGQQDNMRDIYTMSQLRWPE